MGKNYKSNQIRWMQNVGTKTFGERSILTECDPTKHKPTRSIRIYSVELCFFRLAIFICISNHALQETFFVVIGDNLFTRTLGIINM